MILKENAINGIILSLTRTNPLFQLTDKRDKIIENGSTVIELGE